MTKKTALALVALTLAALILSISYVAYCSRQWYEQVMYNDAKKVRVPWSDGSVWVFSDDSRNATMEVER